MSLGLLKTYFPFVHPLVSLLTRSTDLILHCWLKSVPVHGLSELVKLEITYRDARALAVHPVACVLPVVTSVSPPIRHWDGDGHTALRSRMSLAPALITGVGLTPPDDRLMKSSVGFSRQR